MDEFSHKLNLMMSKLNGNALVEATDAAGQIIYNEIETRAKGSIKDNLTKETFKTKTGARSTIQVKKSAKGGIEHHAVFLEYGTVKMAAQPFMRPGFDASEAKALDKFVKILAKELES